VRPPHLLRLGKHLGWWVPRAFEKHVFASLSPWRRVLVRFVLPFLHGFVAVLVLFPAFALIRGNHRFLSDSFGVVLQYALAFGGVTLGSYFLLNSIPDYVRFTGNKVEIQSLRRSRDLPFEKLRSYGIVSLQAGQVEVRTLLFRPCDGPPAYVEFPTSVSESLVVEELRGKVERIDAA
jgi:hypothetical protein